MNKQGFTYTSILVNLLVATFLLPIIVSSLRLIANINLNKMEVQNELGLLQLRRDMLISYDLEVSLNEIRFNYKGDECSLVYQNNHLYRTPGTVIYLQDIDYAVFEENFSNVYLIYYKDDHEYKRIIF